MEDKNIWGLHNTRNEEDLLEDNIIAIGWKEMGNLAVLDNTRDAYTERYNEVYPDKK